VADGGEPFAALSAAPHWPRSICRRSVLNSSWGKSLGKRGAARLDLGDREHRCPTHSQPLKVLS
jgi:hypothetical protein